MYTRVWILMRSPAQWTFKMVQLASCRFLHHGAHCQGDNKASVVALSSAFWVSGKEEQPENVSPSGTTHWVYRQVTRFSAIKSHNIYNKWQNLHLLGFYSQVCTSALLLFFLCPISRTSDNNKKPSYWHVWKISSMFVTLLPGNSGSRNSWC